MQRRNSPPGAIRDLFGLSVDCNSSVLARSEVFREAMQLPHKLRRIGTKGRSITIEYGAGGLNLQAVIDYLRSHNGVSAMLRPLGTGRRQADGADEWIRSDPTGHRPSVRDAPETMVQNTGSGTKGQPSDQAHVTRAEPTRPSPGEVLLTIDTTYGEITLNAAQWETIQRLNQRLGRTIELKSIERAIQRFAISDDTQTQADSDHGESWVYTWDVEDAGDAIVISVQWRDQENIDSAGRITGRLDGGKVIYAARMLNANHEWQDLRGTKLKWQWRRWMAHLSRHPHMVYIEHTIEADLFKPRVIAMRSDSKKRDEYNPNLGREIQISMVLADPADRCTICGNHVAAEGEWWRAIVWYPDGSIYTAHRRPTVTDVEHDYIWTLQK